MNGNGALTVTQLNIYIKALMEGDDFLRTVAIRGEISNFVRHTSGHLYFSLKDESAEISAVMFKGSADKLKFMPKSGMKVTLYGRISVYEKTGKYQVYVNAMTDDGIGALHEQYMRLLEKLKAEGLFSPERKRAIPKFPKRIGIVTSPTGAAIRDMINVTGRRYPAAEIVLCPALVQGTDAPADLCRALALLCAEGDCDVIIIGRGGGSIEDLWAFNDEALVRTVAASPVPIISAVGHETDTTLCDFAADMRAPTPSAAAEQAVPDRLALAQLIDEKSDRAERALMRVLDSYRERVRSQGKHIDALSPDARLLALRQRVSSAGVAMDAAVNATLENRRLRLAGVVGRLDAVNPLAVIARGYSIAMGADGSVVRSTDAVDIGSDISVRVTDGIIDATVKGIRK